MPIHRSRAELLINCRARVAEGPTYDPTTDTLLWVDIPRGHLWRYALNDGRPTYRDLGQPLGSIAIIERGGLLLAARRGILVMSGWSAVPVLWREIEPDRPTQFNDGKCDARGRFIAGTADPSRRYPGTLYRIDHDGTTQPLVPGIGMSNGLDWTPDEQYFFHVDSIDQTVVRYEWDAVAGIPRNPVRFIEIPRRDGIPDGLTIDSDGHLWLALWGAGQVRRFDPSGCLVEVVDVPTPHVTSCTFGGRDLRHLYITTAAHQPQSKEDVSASGGAVYVLQSSVHGQKHQTFPRTYLPLSDIEFS